MRLIILIFMIFGSLNAVSIEAKYRVTFGIFGQIGTAKTALHVENQKYKIRVHVKSTGIANFLSGEREEWYVSSGIVDDNGILVPDYYQKIVQRYSTKDGELIVKKDIKKYVFYHNIKEIQIERTRHRGEKISFKMKKSDYYALDDLLSLFFNFKKILPSLEVESDLVFYAAGANKTDGRIDIKPLHVEKRLGWRDGHAMRVIINDDIFASEKGELLVNLRDDGIVQQAVLKDVLFFGDIRGEIVD